MTTNNFHTTHWSVVLAAKGDDTKAKTALRELCESYYVPVRRFIERQVTGDSVRRYGGRDADDLVQDFMARLLEGKMFTQLERNGGRFRSYLLGAVKHFLIKTHDRESTQKRGGELVQIPFPTDPQGEFDYNDTLFDRDWAQTLLDNAMAFLLDGSPATKVLIPWLTKEVNAETRNRIALETGMSEGAVKVALHRLRKKFRQHVREQIAKTVESEEEIGVELDYLIYRYHYSEP
ncbi:MAG: RNA polymerase sigma factor [Thermoguttaceae bacterium]